MLAVTSSYMIEAWSFIFTSRWCIAMILFKGEILIGTTLSNLILLLYTLTFCLYQQWGGAKKLSIPTFKSDIQLIE